MPEGGTGNDTDPPRDRSPSAAPDVVAEPDQKRRLAMVVRRAGYNRERGSVCLFFRCPFLRCPSRQQCTPPSPPPLWSCHTRRSEM
jgi:hypothetical protein